MTTDYFLHQDSVSVSICWVAHRVESRSYAGDGLALFNRQCCSQSLNQLCPPGAVSSAQALPISPAAPSGSSPMSSFALSGSVPLCSAHQTQQVSSEAACSTTPGPQSEEKGFLRLGKRSCFKKSLACHW